MSTVQAVISPFGVIALLAFVAFLWLHASGGFLIRQGKLIYVIRNEEAGNADLPDGTRISYHTLAVISLVAGVVFFILFTIF